MPIQGHSPSTPTSPPSRTPAPPPPPPPPAPIILPPPHILYLLLTSPSLSTLSRTSTLLAFLKSAFEATTTIARYSPALTAQFNGYLIDACNLLWRSRALLTSDANAVGCLSPEPAKQPLHAWLTELDPEFGLPGIFGVSTNYLLAAASCAVLRGMEERAEEAAREEGGTGVRHAGPATQRSLAVLGNEGGLEVSWK
ncbi:hypothetical protein H2201_006835 [Coniosporium apollinis]|uniref:Transcription factor domain-containing protein n=1 Tax=Coniosporium apollinis TaxID=61459 RepID=A0ABQ9NN94_9PEZI|nr:hypothetical protein H2201_006835 [Coniosporium apollinis]